MENIKVLLIDSNSQQEDIDYNNTPINIQRRIDNYKNIDDRKLSWINYKYLNKLLEIYGCSLSDVTFTENGKPYISGEDIHISLSHSGRYGVVVTSKNKIGIDVQQIKDIKYNKVINNCFSEDDKAIIDSSLDKLTKFYEIFSQKECLIKVYGKTVKDLKTIRNKDNLMFYTFIKNGYIITICYNRKAEIKICEI